MGLVRLPSVTSRPVLLGHLLVAQQRLLACLLLLQLLPPLSLLPVVTPDRVVTPHWLVPLLRFLLLQPTLHPPHAGLVSQGCSLLNQLPLLPPLLLLPVQPLCQLLLLLLLNPWLLERWPVLLQACCVHQQHLAALGPRGLL